MKVLAALSVGLLGALLGNAQLLSAAEQDSLTAIEILLEPDQTMIEKATAANDRLREAFPKGFALDETHKPHISTLQRYVRTADLDKVYEAVGNVLAGEKPASWELKAYKYFYVVWDKLGLAGILIEPTDDFIRYQEKLIDAVAPFTVETGTAAAFVTDQEDPDINQPTIDYVAHYVPSASGDKFKPHVTIGLAPLSTRTRCWRRSSRRSRSLRRGRGSIISATLGPRGRGSGVGIWRAETRVRKRALLLTGRPLPLRIDHAASDHTSSEPYVDEPLEEHH